MKPNVRLRFLSEGAHRCVEIDESGMLVAEIDADVAVPGPSGKHFGAAHAVDWSFVVGLRPVDAGYAAHVRILGEWPMEADFEPLNGEATVIACGQRVSMTTDKAKASVLTTALFFTELLNGNSFDSALSRARATGLTLKRGFALNFLHLFATLGYPMQPELRQPLLEEAL